jgi:hypothetical protein
MSAYLDDCLAAWLCCYGFHTGAWEGFAVALPFALGLTPVYAKLRASANRDPDSLLMSYLLFLPIVVSSIFLGELVRHGLLRATILTFGLTAFWLVIAFFLHITRTTRVAK